MSRNHNHGSCPECDRNQSKRDHLKHVSKFDKNRLMTDRNAYIQFLETQLERVTSSCMTVQTFTDRLEQLNAANSNTEAKLANVAKLVKLSQSLADERDHDTNKSQHAIVDRVLRLEDIEARREPCHCSHHLSLIEEKFAELERRQAATIDTVRLDTQGAATRLQSQLDVVREELAKTADRLRTGTDSKFSVISQDIGGISDQLRALASAIEREGRDRAQLDSHVHAKLQETEARCAQTVEEANSRTDQFHQRLSQSIEALDTRIASDITSLVETVRTLESRVREDIFKLVQSSDDRFSQASQGRDSLLDQVRGLSESHHSELQRLMEVLETSRKVTEERVEQQIRDQEEKINFVHQTLETKMNSQFQVQVQEREKWIETERVNQDLIQKMNEYLAAQQGSNDVEHAEVRLLERKMKTRLMDMVDKINALVANSNQNQTDIHNIRRKVTDLELGEAALAAEAKLSTPKAKRIDPVGPISTSAHSPTARRPPSPLQKSIAELQSLVSNMENPNVSRGNTTTASVRFNQSRTSDHHSPRVRPLNPISYTH